MVPAPARHLQREDLRLMHQQAAPPTCRSQSSSTPMPHLLLRHLSRSNCSWPCQRPQHLLMPLRHNQQQHPGSRKGPRQAPHLAPELVVSLVSEWVLSGRGGAAGPPRTTCCCCRAWRGSSCPPAQLCAPTPGRASRTSSGSSCPATSATSPSRTGAVTSWRPRPGASATHETPRTLPWSGATPRRYCRGVAGRCARRGQPRAEESCGVVDGFGSTRCGECDVRERAGIDAPGTVEDWEF
mmetsp:Transcript_8576/g.18233  ORF Transcript_8576/g.18233 Transcript_8576/m.18233 type:complete len:240 (+) Transcript_8576:441-1160(+)